jgi:hypothetical protein
LIYSVAFDCRPSMDMNNQVDALGNRLIGYSTKRKIGQGVVCDNQTKVEKKTVVLLRDPFGKAMDLSITGYWMWIVPWK